MKTAALMYLSKRKNIFFIVSIIIAVAMCCFHSWLYWPGFIHDDSQTTFLLSKSGWHPAIMAWMVELMYKIFGMHIYDLFLITIVPFYVGIWLIVYTVYLKTKSWFSLLLFLPCFIGNIFYAIIKLGTSSFALAYAVLLYAMTLYMLLNPINKKYKRYWFVLYALIFVLALLGRHNAIIQIWPVTFVWIWMYLSAKNFSFFQYFWRFTAMSFASGIFCSVLLISLNFILSSSDKGHVYPAQMITIHQIVGTCSPVFDESCFEKDWWRESWSNNPNRMKKLYNLYRENILNPEAFVLPNYQNIPFKPYTNLEGRFSKLFYAIKKYPHNYYEHIYRYYFSVWFLPANIIPQEALTNKYTRRSMIRHTLLWSPVSEREKAKFVELAMQMPRKELSIKFTDFQKSIDNYIRKNFPSYNIIYFIVLNFIFFVIGCILFLKNRKNKLYIYLFATSSAGVLSNIIIPLFCPVIFIRYMDPLIMCTFLSLVTVFLLFFQIMENLSQQKSGVKAAKKIRRN